MEYNPHAGPLEELEVRFKRLEDEIGDIDRELQWYRAFNSEELTSELRSLEKQLRSLETEGRLAESRRVKARQRADDLKEAAALTLNPKRWFASDRKEAARARDEFLREAEELQIKGQALQEKQARRRESVAAVEAQLNKYRAYDRLEAEARREAARLQLEGLKAPLSALRHIKAKVDEQLAPLLKNLAELKAERQKLAWDLSDAEVMESKLSRAANPYEKAMIHQQCQARFKEGKPRVVIQRKQRALEAVDRDIQKAEARLQMEVQRATRTISELVIDGNNLCYRDGTFIGVAAVTALANRLAEEFKVTVVFDPGIRGMTRLSSTELGALFKPAVAVHVVDSTRAADEVLMDVAAESTAFVISADRFRDFGDRPAVRERRVLRPEIFPSQILLPDLGLRVGY